MKLALAVLSSSVVLAGCAAGPRAPDHAAHHPQGAPAAPTSGHMDMTMQSMQAMHDRMMAAKTPEERSRLMQEHRKLMQDHMTMMGRMHGGMGGGMPMNPEMMGKRMDMMEMMMKMMMDREAMMAPAAK